MPYAVYVDEKDMIWVSDFGANAMLRFDPENETFEVFPFPRADANVRQILGRSDEVWGGVWNRPVDINQNGQRLNS